MAMVPRMCWAAAYEAACSCLLALPPGTGKGTSVLEMVTTFMEATGG